MTGGSEGEGDRPQGKVGSSGRHRVRVAQTAGCRAAPKRSRVTPSAQAVVPASPEVVTELRSRSAVLLGEALEDSSPLLDLGVGVEAAVFDAHGHGSSYTTAVRGLVAALRRNTALREDVHAGRVTPAELVAAPADMLATSEQRCARAVMEKRAAQAATLDGVGDGAVHTTETACPACAARDAYKVSVGGVRDIGKSETWGSKDAGDASVKTRLHCIPCKARSLMNAHVAPRASPRRTSPPADCSLLCRIAHLQLRSTSGTSADASPSTLTSPIDGAHAAWQRRCSSHCHVAEWGFPTEVQGLPSQQPSERRSR